jgi:hypothetical protein
MATSRPFAYNPSRTLIPGTEQVGDLAIAVAEQYYSEGLGGVRWWMGPNEDPGYIICYPFSAGTKPSPDGNIANIGFKRSQFKTEESFVAMSNAFAAGQATFSDGTEAYLWLNLNGYWTSYIPVTPTPTSSSGPSVTPTSTPTPTTPLTCDSFTFNSISANTTTTSAIKTSVGGWDSSAYSVESYTNPITLTFQTTANGNILMGGFSYNPTANAETYVNISYGIYLQNNFIEIYENGNQVYVPGSITTLSTDVWKVEYNGTNVTYYKNNVLIYTSSNSVTQPLHAFFALYTLGEGVNNVCLTETSGPSVTPTPSPTETSGPSVTPTPSPTETSEPSVTPTPSPTETSGPSVTPTPSPTETSGPTPTPSITPTNTPTPSSSPEPVTGYSFNLVALPYNFPEAGNSIMNNPPDNTSGSTEINLLSTTGRGFYFNSIDSSSVDRTNYYSGFTGQSITITFSQTGNTAIYSGDTNSLKYWESSPTDNGFVFGTGIGTPSLPPSGTAVLIQSATTQFTIGLPVFVSLVEN